MITVYEYIKFKCPWVIRKLNRLRIRQVARMKKYISAREIIDLMQHDRWKRVNGALRQVNSVKFFY